MESALRAVGSCFKVETCTRSIQNAKVADRIASMLRKEYMMGKYGKSAQRLVRRAMHKLKKGTLRSGKRGNRVTSREQAVAIGLSEARRKGAKVPAQ